MRRGRLPLVVMVRRPYRHLRRRWEPALNDRGGDRNPGDVHFFRQTMALAAVPLLTFGASLLGCAGGRSLGLGEIPPGITAIQVLNHVAAPGELERLTIAVDSEP